jgi:H+-transporting ATPase
MNCNNAGFEYNCRRGLNNIFILLIGGIPIAMPTVLSITLAVGARQLTKDKAIATRIITIKELGGVAILYDDATGTLTTNKLTIDKATIVLMVPCLPTMLCSLSEGAYPLISLERPHLSYHPSHPP